MVPLMVDLSGRNVVIFGGGTVGSRKAAFFAGHAGTVTVVSRSFGPAFGRLPVRRVAMDLAGAPETEIRGLLEGAFLAVAATPDRELNNRIGACCREAGVLFNNADGEPGDVLVPSVIRGEYHAIAITTYGRAPAVSRYLRELLERTCPHLDRMVELQGRLRDSLKSREPDQGRREERLRAVLADRDVWDALGRSPDEAWDLAAGRYLHG